MSSKTSRSTRDREPRSEDEWTAVLKTLGVESRLRLLRALLPGPQCVTEISEMLGEPLYTTSRHIKRLREAGIVTSERDGSRVVVDIAPALRERLGPGGAVLDLGCCSFDLALCCPTPPRRG
jgi:ArsR family transcriptional regulator